MVASAGRGRAGGRFDRFGGASGALRQLEAMLYSELAGDFVLLPGVLWRAPVPPGQAQRQSQPAFRSEGGLKGIMTYRSKPVLRLEAGIWA